jgi:hypothetical protein
VALALVGATVSLGIAKSRTSQEAVTAQVLDNETLFDHLQARVDQGFDLYAESKGFEQGSFEGILQRDELKDVVKALIDAEYQGKMSPLCADEGDTDESDAEFRRTLRERVVKRADDQFAEHQVPSESEGAKKVIDSFADASISIGYCTPLSFVRADVLTANQKSVASDLDANMVYFGLGSLIALLFAVLVFVPVRRKKPEPAEDEEPEPAGEPEPAEDEAPEPVEESEPAEDEAPEEEELVPVDVREVNRTRRPLLARRHFDPRIRIRTHEPAPQSRAFKMSRSPR